MKLLPQKSTIFFYAYNVLVSLIVFALALTPFFDQINQQILDQVHSWTRLEARKETVIVGIDDKSLQEIGAWPWDRSVFAKVISELTAAQARVIGIDVLFLEKRSGDEELEKVLKESPVPIILAEKLLTEDKTIEFPYYQLPKEQFGFINFFADGDGKIRSTYPPNAEQALDQTSFSFRILEHYFSSKFVSDKLHAQYPGDYSHIFFNYTHQPFTQISLSDVLNKRVEPSVFKDKIVLIGTTAIDVKSGINDNLIDIFGQSKPGVVIHANVINSFLENRFQHPFPLAYAFAGTLLLTLIFSFVYRVVRSNIVDLIITVVSFLLINIVGFFVFDLGINWPFFIFSSTIIFVYISSLAQKYIMENQQRRFIQMAFAQYMNPALVRQLIANPGQLKLGGEKRTMTVMFSDVRGFTSLSEKISAEDLVSLLNAYMNEMCQVILNNEGVIDKFIGDAIMAFWNAPLDNDRQQELAIKTGVAMVDALAKFNKTHDYDPLDIGIGINTGEMVVGNIGSKQRFDYTVLGDNVNLASRIEGLTKKYGIKFLVTEAVINGVKVDGIIYRHIDTVTVKGKSLPVKLYQPLSDTSENQEVKKTYEAGWDAMAKSDWSTATKLFEKIKEDAPAQVMLKRIPELKEYNPKGSLREGWKGVWEWKEK